MNVSRWTDKPPGTKPAWRTSAEIAEVTGLDPATVAQVIEPLERAGLCTIEAANAAYAERQWHVRGSAYDLDG